MTIIKQDQPDWSTPDLHSSWLSYRPGQTTSSGDVIKEVLQFGDHGIIILNTNDELSWEYDDACPNALIAEHQASDLIAQTDAAGLRSQARRRALLLIANALSTAFESPAVSDPSTFFDNARTFLLVRHTEALQTWYLIAVLISGVTVSSTGFLLAKLAASEVVTLFALAVATGAMGAVLSVSQRFRSIPIDRYASGWFTAIAGISRVAFGGLFGAVFLMFQKSGLVLSVVDDNKFSIATAALIAGFSERLIPELVGTVEDRLLTAGKVTDHVEPGASQVPQ